MLALLALFALGVFAGQHLHVNEPFEAIESARISAKNHAVPTKCFNVLENPFAKVGLSGLPWMCEHQSLCMACNPFRAKSVGDGYEKFRSAFECDFSKCQTYLPYMLCPTDACVAK